MARHASTSKKQLNHAEIGERIGFERSYVSKLLSGKRQCSLEIALQIFDIAGLAIGPLAGKKPSEIGMLRKAQEILAGAA